jgi:hypothetical protein
MTRTEEILLDRDWAPFSCWEVSGKQACIRFKIYRKDTRLVCLQFMRDGLEPIIFKDACESNTFEEIEIMAQS